MQQGSPTAQPPQPAQMQAQVSAPATSPTAAARRCCVCRSHAASSQLLRVRWQNDTLCFDARGGRGTYVCPHASCLDVLLKPKTCQRLLRLKGPVAFEPAVVRGQLHELARRRVLEMIGLSRRMGALRVGVDTLAKGAIPSDGWCARASDLAERSQRALAQVPTFGTASELGAAAGMQRVGALCVAPQRLAEQASFWWQVWSQTAPATVIERQDPVGQAPLASDSQVTTQPAVERL